LASRSEQSGWPDRVRGTGRVAQRQEAAPCRFNLPKVRSITAPETPTGNRGEDDQYYPQARSPGKERVAPNPKLVTQIPVPGRVVYCSAKGDQAASSGRVCRASASHGASAFAGEPLDRRQRVINNETRWR